MKKYIYLFNTHNGYKNFIKGPNKVYPNISFCKDNNEVHFNKPIEKIKIYFDDFPQDICDDEFDGDMAAFKQQALDDLNDPSWLAGNAPNAYIFTGETLEYNGHDYYLWVREDPDNLWNPMTEDSDRYTSTVLYIITDTLDFTGKSLEDNINNNYCPFVALLNDDKETYALQNSRQDVLLAVKKEGYLL